ncbi:hypothetical protein Pan44_37360 [Caulifigura coniformis]|uniref:Uncharacterized protein n=1 Tax=Caulifigura coniformis TaxID=2527983 RepID=A0A517SHT1_9PLAN|nr:SIR2 family protein [Caulifigura coniformis]QDT55690.1 hypothetical protein Pan44_37360 [Caulifigura coniformis]
MKLLLFGAGASGDAKVPTSVEMTKELVARVVQTKDKRLVPMIHFIVGGLMFRTGMSGHNPLDGIDVEELFRAVELLAHREDFEGVAFIGSWHQMVEQLDRATVASGRVQHVLNTIFDELFRQFQNGIPQFPNTLGSGTIDRAIQDAVKQHAGRGPSFGSNSVRGVEGAITDTIRKALQEWVDRMRRSRFSVAGLTRRDPAAETLGQVLSDAANVQSAGLYGKLATQLLHFLVDVVWITDGSRVEYLAALGELSRRQNGLAIASLNYDNAVELYAKQAGLTVSDGVESWSETGTVMFEHADIKLMKLHGSIDWVSADTKPTPERPYRTRAISKVAPEDIGKDKHLPAVVFGHRNKLTAKGPFLDLLFAFREELHRASELVVVGYSFRDEHVNEYIGQWLNGGVERTMTIISRRGQAGAGPFVKAVVRAGKGRVRFIAAKASDGLQQVLAMNDTPDSQ